MRLPLSPEVAKTLLLTCFAEQDRWERSALVQEITRRFIAQGGTTDVTSVVSPLKRALGELRSEGLIISIGKGLWARVPEGSSDIDSVKPKGIPLQPRRLSGIYKTREGSRPTTGVIGNASSCQPKHPSFHNRTGHHP